MQPDRPDVDARRAALAKAQDDHERFREQVLADPARRDAYIQARIDAAYQRGLAEGRRQAAEGLAYTDTDERRVGDALEDYYRRMGAPPSMTRPYGAARIALDAATADGRRLVGPWETAEQPEPAPAAEETPSMHWQCTRCGLDLDGNPRFCWGCGYTVYRPIHHAPATGGVVDPAVRYELGGEDVTELVQPPGLRRRHDPGELMEEPDLYEQCQDCLCCTRVDCAGNRCGACPCTEG